MPRFFFSLTDGDRLDDGEGLDLPDEGEALARAGDELRRYTAQIIGDDAHLNLASKLEVTDDQGRPVGVVHLTSVVTVLWPDGRSGR